MNKDISTNASKSGSGSNSRDKGEGSSFSVDFELQEVVSKRLIRDSKVRLAFYHSIMGMKPIQATLIYLSALTLIVTCLSCYIGFVVNFNSRIIWRKNAYSDIRSAGYSLFFTFYANFITIMQWAKSTQRYDDNRAILGDLTINATTVKYIINDKFNRPQKIIYAVNFSRNSLTNLFNAFSSLANEYNVYDIGTNILRQECKLVVCDKNKPFTEITATVKDHILMMNFFQSSFAGTLLKNETIPNIYDNNDWCQVFSNSIILSEYSEKSLKSILDFNIKEADKYTVAFKTWMIAGSIAIIILSAGPALIIINTYNYHINKTLKMLLSLPTNIKEDAKKPIVITNQTEEEPLNAMTKAKVSKVMDYIAIGFFTLLFSDTAIFCVMCYRAIQANEELTDMYEWYYLSCVRVLSSTQAGNNAIHILLLNGSLKNDIISLASLKAKALKDLDDLITADKALLEGNGEIKKIIGYDEQYDKLQLQEVCSLNRDPKSIHDMYACAGIGHQIIIFKNMVSDILNNPGKYDGVIDDEVSANIAHLLQYHFFPRVIAATTRMRDMIDERYAAGVRSNRLLLIGGLVISFIMEIMPWLFRYFVNENYKLLLICFKRIFPRAIVATPEIMEFFKSSKKSSKEENMSISKSIVMDASECIIITNQSAIVEIINSSVTANLNMTPDQMLGQHIANFVSSKDQQRLNQQIDLMMSGQGSSFWQDHIELVNETAEVIPFAITMIGMKDKEESSEINSIVFILTNETEEKKKLEEAEIAKAKSEKLLYQILPKDIVIRLNRGETDISFTINSATIFFIDIVKFSNYASTLTPTEIMTNLSLVFATFDKIVAQYPTITKIKLIGDVYMAAAGLFNDNPEDTKHAEEAVRCCIQCQKAMEEINMKLNASLEIRIGVNSGGPLIGGVLGSDKPTFDIIGDPINVAARLQSTDIPGNVQISAGTKELIENLDFEIEERGEIYLKGKGKQMTYFASKRERSDIEGSFAINIQEKKDN
ncbi:Adenylate and Guanylate cyclase catalytic domain containing protein [Trichomonas vaginalis G3]|uniref:Adenylate and Guanylate cyclase catalytic domain containing protein n=1 Tax=Trichomonas vaginalis (strain ATCC PRA-98 / G3) TaxID=412133 RepID=A2FXW9_TRIV3|nr:guanylate cyclase protein [Trichomonas vaginalis G3]EAX90243.1 Adenylate and Guanylate cyclase catalytic domain containing protein [Trichomonas vaginalis G3]KAI5510212.1 guanylate cyclase protein [Trichomonas vaginalis G3]|eukprot:XP_001303173.1 Adenylate and Guanylate cyclase catalytic domain containing protein [Trichomonas vaginalis G3]